MKVNNSSRIKLINHSTSSHRKIPSKRKKVTAKQKMDQNLTQQIQSIKIETERGMAMPELDQTNEDPIMEVHEAPADQPFNFSGAPGKDLSYLNYLNNPKNYIHANGELQNLMPKQEIKYKKRVTNEKFPMRQPSTFANISESWALDQPTNNKKVLGRTGRVRDPSEY
jgi:hypothetical protein